MIGYLANASRNAPEEDTPTGTSIYKELCIILLLDISYKVKYAELPSSDRTFFFVRANVHVKGDEPSPASLVTPRLRLGQTNRIRLYL